MCHILQDILEGFLINTDNVQFCDHADRATVVNARSDLLAVPPSQTPITTSSRRHDGAANVDNDDDEQHVDTVQPTLPIALREVL